MKKGKLDKANEVLHKIRRSYNEEEIKEELEGIQETIENNLRVSFGVIVKELLSWKTLERLVLRCKTMIS